MKLTNILLWIVYLLCFTEILWYPLLLPVNFGIDDRLAFDFYIQVLEITLIIVAFFKSRFSKTAKDTLMLKVFFFSYLLKCLILPWYFVSFILYPILKLFPTSNSLNVF